MTHTNMMRRVLVERDSLLQRRSELMGKLMAHHAAREERQRADEVYYQLVQTVAVEEVRSASSGAPTSTMSDARVRLEEETASRSRAQMWLDGDRETLVHECVVPINTPVYPPLFFFCTDLALQQPCV
jgi:hypothetical protein